jgi:hypothetical protein
MRQRRREIESPIVPKEYAGMWIAWDQKETKIIASGRTFAEAQSGATLAGEAHPVFAKVPKFDVRFVGNSA